MAAKATLRRNGRHMFTIRAQYDLDINELIDRITARIFDYGDNLPQSQAAALKMARDHCAEYGNSQEKWSDDCDDWDEYRADVADRMRLIFPQLAGEIAPAT
jgi:hypothetical protein